MTLHSWGDPDFDWDSLNDAIRFIDRNLRRFRVGVRDSKEKWGQCRIYCDLGFHCLLSITHPGHMSYNGRYPKWLTYLDIYYISRVVRLLNVVVVPIHRVVYRQVYAAAVRRWPHIASEITCAADYPELLRGLHAKSTGDDTDG